MIVTYNWLKEFVDISLPPQELADILTMLGLEVEGMECRGEGLDEVVVALVEEKSQHPNADKLSLCKVNNGKELLSIVCGAQNFKAGDKVALAQIGAVLPGDFKIKRSKIRGEESFGMLCSEKELALAESSDGIMVLPADSCLGRPVFEALGLKDTVFEIGLTPNRADCLSVVGIAREIAAKLGLTLKSPGHEVVEGGELASAFISVQIDDPQYCPRYTARYISGCKIGPSPQWLVDRLTAVGMRSINNVVDVTNYVLMEYGHPLHAFDFDLLAGGEIVVRLAAEGEKFTALDEQERILKATDLTIRDGKKAVALAGIMGGGNSEISKSTTNILLESAYFNPSAIRLTSKRLGLHTESSHRFERGTDINILTRAVDRAAVLIADLAGGTVARGIVDVYPQKAEERVIRTRLERINQILGLSLGTEEVCSIFQSLEFKVETVEPGVFDVSVPTFRVDLEREIDLVEEVARLNGYEKIPATMPIARVLSDKLPKHQRLERLLRDSLVGMGFNEVINFSFFSPSVFDRICLNENDARRQVVKVLNPIVEEQSVMRTTLLPSLLETAERNMSHRLLNQRLFELRRIYQPIPGRELPVEPLCLAGLLSGKREAEGWNQDKSQLDYYDAKGVVEALLEELAIANVAFVARDLELFYHPGKSCSLFSGNELIGSLGEIHPDVQENFGIEQSVYYFELDVEKLIKLSKESVAIVPPSRFPDTFRDIAMLLADEVEAASIISCIEGLKIKEMEGVEIFDLYKGANISEGMKSVAVRVRYRSNEKTLNDEEVTVMHQKVVAALTNKINASIR